MNNEIISVAEYSKICKITTRDGYRHRSRNYCAIPGKWVEGSRPASFEKFSNSSVNNRNDARLSNRNELQENNSGSYRKSKIFTVDHPEDSATDDGGVQIVSYKELQEEISNKFNDENDNSDYETNDDNNDDDDDSNRAYIDDLVEAADLDEELKSVATRAGLGEYEVPGGKLTVAAVAILSYGIPKLFSYFNKRKKTVGKNNLSETHDGVDTQERPSSDSPRQQSPFSLKMDNGVPTYEQ